MVEEADSLGAPAPVGEPLTAEVIEPETQPRPDPAKVAAEEQKARVDQQRRDWAQRIRDERRLPGALRERLAVAVEQSAEFGGGDEPQIAITQVASIFAEATPALLRLERPRSVAPHPGGEAFFRAGQLSDDDAARIASEQLARTGFAN